MSSSCNNIRKEVIECIRESPCVQIEKKSWHECLKRCKDDSDESVPEECKLRLQALFYCKKNQIDMRKRFRGNRDTEL
eukprot:TRINITY_DN86031_c0_g1_i1.p1 TRINITY_DN86031_c0_g1~~TRINITY_DN86031_c0_g1_i1.p1  ORF type:complete len:78 (-),score=6.10 TRINITY_DN86031_c0_g1_i1:45-278(-)